MSDNEFFTLNQELWFEEFVQAELSKNFKHTNAPVEKFEFDDIPF